MPAQNSIPETFTEKRSTERIPFDAEIVFTYFMANSEGPYRAQTVNHSPSGLEFKTDFSIAKGAGVYIRAADDRVCSGSLSCLRTTTLAEVKWCRASPDAAGYRFRVGVRYY